MSERIVPSVGGWFCFPQTVVRIDPKAPDTKEHRWIVVGNGIIHTDPPVVLRSTKPYGGLSHARHDGACGTPECRIDRPGWIRTTEVRTVPSSEFTADRMSCHEPNSDLIEELMGRARQRPRRAGTRRRRRGR